MQKQKKEIIEVALSGVKIGWIKSGAWPSSSSERSVGRCEETRRTSGDSILGGEENPEKSQRCVRGGVHHLSRSREAEAKRGVFF